MLANLYKDNFDLRECVIDYDATCANVLPKKFPEAERDFCENRTVKTFHAESFQLCYISPQFTENPSNKLERVTGYYTRTICTVKAVLVVGRGGFHEISN